MRFKLSVFSKSFYPNLFYLPYLNHIWSSFSLKTKIEFFGSKFFFIVSRWGRAKFRKFSKLEKLLEREDFFGPKIYQIVPSCPKGMGIYCLSDFGSWRNFFLSFLPRDEKSNEICDLCQYKIQLFPPYYGCNLKK